MLKVSLPVALVLSCLSPTIVSAQTSLPISQPIAGVDAIKVEISGHSGLYLFDSGWGVSAVTPAMASVIGCTPWGKITGFRATGERVDLQRCNAADLRLGVTVLHLPELGMIDLTKYMGALSDRFAGGIGLNAFDGQTVTVSVARHALVIESEKSKRKIVATATEVPIRLVRDSQGAALTADIGIPTKLGMLWLEIDTGNYGPSRIDRTAAALLGLDPATKGRQKLNAPVNGVVQFGGSASVGDLIMDGNLGRDALKDWDITLDLVRGRGWVRPATATSS